jgi:hypothetical protein
MASVGGLHSFLLLQPLTDQLHLGHPTLVSVTVSVTALVVAQSPVGVPAHHHWPHQLVEQQIELVEFLMAVGVWVVMEAGAVPGVQLERPPAAVALCLLHLPVEVGSCRLLLLVAWGFLHCLSLVPAAQGSLSPTYNTTLLDSMTLYTLPTSPALPTSAHYVLTVAL